MRPNPNNRRSFSFEPLSQNCEKRSVRLPFRMEQRGSHWTDFQEIWYMKIFRKSAEKIQVSLKRGENNGHFTWRPHSLHLLSVLLRMRNVQDKSCRENRNSHFVFSNPPENRAVYEIMCKNIVEPDRPQMTVWRRRISRWIPKATHTHTHTQYVHAHWFYIAKAVAQTHLTVRRTYIACLVSLFFTCFSV